MDLELIQFVRSTASISGLDHSCPAHRIKVAIRLSNIYDPMMCKQHFSETALFWCIYGWAISIACLSCAGEGTESDGCFRTGRIISLKLSISSNNVSELGRSPRSYLLATLAAGENTYDSVAVRLKGGAGSFRNLEDRPCFTVNFGKFIKGQRFHGMEKIHLNNSVQDPTYMTELLCGELFLAAGIPAARATHVRVELNGRDLGVYVLKEGFDKGFLKRYFNSSEGNLYDGGFIQEITERLHKNSGDPESSEDLEALAKAAQESDPAKRWAELGRVLDMERFLSFMAMETITGHWDGYCARHNNYRIYHDSASDKMVFLPHGMDQMFWEPTSPLFPHMEGLVARAVITTVEGRRRYRERVGFLLTNVFNVERLTNRMNEVQARIRPLLHSINPDAARSHDAYVSDLRRRTVEVLICDLRRRRAGYLSVRSRSPSPLRSFQCLLQRCANYEASEPAIEVGFRSQVLRPVVFYAEIELFVSLWPSEIEIGNLVHADDQFVYGREILSGSSFLLKQT